MRILKPAALLHFFIFSIISFWATICIAAVNPVDPYENYNRHAYKFNDKLDTVILKPIATIYKKVLPPPAMKGVNNFFSNLSQIPTVINDVLQLNFKQALSDTWRFTVNSTIGVLGIMDVASDIGLESHLQDFGLTLAKWGYKDSSYFVLPFFGPSTIRDAVAKPINYNFFTVYPYIKSDRLRYSLLGLYYVDARAQYLDLEDLRKGSAYDPYVFERNAYLQHRNTMIRRNNTEADVDTYVEQ